MRERVSTQLTCFSSWNRSSSSREARRGAASVTLLVQVLLLRLLPESALAVDRERVAVGKTVTAQRFADE